MKITRRDTKEKIFFPPPLYVSAIVATAESDGGDVFDIALGLTQSMTAKLKERSIDPTDDAIQKNTGDRKRFGEGSYEAWYTKQRVPFALIHRSTNALAALIWLGPKPLGKKSARFSTSAKAAATPPSTLDKIANARGEWHTVTLRSYPPFRGKGLMKDFARFAIAIYRERFPGARFWIGTDPENSAMIALAKKLEFITREELSDRSTHWLVMTQDWK